MHEVEGIVAEWETGSVRLGVGSNWMVRLGNVKRLHLNIHPKKANAGTAIGKLFRHCADTAGKVQYALSRAEGEIAQDEVRREDCHMFKSRYFMWISLAMNVFGHQLPQPKFYLQICYSSKDSKTDVSKPDFALPDADSDYFLLDRFRQELNSLLTLE